MEELRKENEALKKGEPATPKETNYSSESQSADTEYDSQ